MKLGWFDLRGKNPYDRITEKAINSEANRLLAKRAAVESIGIAEQ
jgi:hypothetical protein